MCISQETFTGIIILSKVSKIPIYINYARQKNLPCIHKLTWQCTITYVLHDNRNLIKVCDWFTLTSIIYTQKADLHENARTKIISSEQNQKHDIVTCCFLLELFGMMQNWNCDRFVGSTELTRCWIIINIRIIFYLLVPHDIKH